MNPLTARMEIKSLFANMPASTTTCMSPKSSCWEMNKISFETTLSRNVKVTITEIRATRTHERVFTCWTGRRWRLIGQYCDVVSLPFFFVDYLTYFNVTFSKNLRVLFGPKVIYMCNFFFQPQTLPIAATRWHCDGSWWDREPCALSHSQVCENYLSLSDVTYWWWPFHFASAGPSLPNRWIFSIFTRMASV